MKMRNRTLAIDAAPAAIPPKPRSAAISAMTRNVIAQDNMFHLFLAPRAWAERRLKTTTFVTKLPRLPFRGISGEAVPFLQDSR